VAVTITKCQQVSGGTLQVVMLAVLYMVPGMTAELISTNHSVQLSCQEQTDIDIKKVMNSTTAPLHYQPWQFPDMLGAQPVGTQGASNST
jgi:hypothetical protein